MKKANNTGALRDRMDYQLQRSAEIFDVTILRAATMCENKTSL
jgi:hypothetical protein